MKVKVSNAELIDNAPILRELSQEDLPIKISYAISKNLIKIDKELEVYNKKKIELLDKYVLKDEKGYVTENNELKFKDESSKQEYINNTKELLKIENEIDFHEITFEELSSIKEITPRKLMAIDCMIKE